MTIILLHFSFAGLGLGLLNLLFRKACYPWSLKVGIGYFTGLLIHILLLHGALVVPALNFQFNILLWTLMFLGMAGWLCEAAFCRRVNRLFRRPQARNLTPARAVRWLVNSMLALVMLPPVMLVALRLVGLPDVDFDSTAFWNLKARLFFHGDSVLSPSFTDPARVHAHPHYPLYMPIFNLEHYLVLGATDDQKAKLGVLIFYFAGLLVYTRLLGRWLGSFGALLALGILLYTPIYSYATVPGAMASTFVDFPLSMTIALGLLFLLRFEEEHHEVDHWAVLVMLSSAFLLKREGLAWVILFSPVTLVLAVRLGRMRRPIYWGPWFMLGIIVAGWMTIKARLPNDAPLVWPREGITMHALKAAELMLNDVTQSLLTADRWGWLPWVILSGTICGVLLNRCRPQVLLINFSAWLYGSTTLGVLYFFSQNYISVARDRLILQVIPALFALSLVLCAQPSRKNMSKKSAS